MAVHHAHLRKHTSKNEVRRLDHIMMVLVGLTPLTHVPQLIKIYTEKVAALSLLTWGLYFALCIPWLVYGLIHKERIIAYTYLMNIVMYTGIIAGIVLYG